MNYGKAIKIVRAAHGLTQRELAARLSVGPSALSLIEAGKRQPSVGVLDEIASVLHVPPHLLTVLASESNDIDKRIDPRQLADLAKSLLELLVASGEQPTLPISKQAKHRKLKRAG
jgi:transcriptional regulator with XRE-family HTH domain